MRALVLSILLVPAAARADEWDARVEAGAEWDSNVHRVEVDPEGTVEAVAVPLGRAGGRVDGRGEPGRWGTWSFGGQGLVRKVIGGEGGEDVGVAAADARWDRRLGARHAQIGARASYYDVIALGPGTGARTFALGAADALLLLGGDHGERFALSAGARDFRYKPDDDFDWRGVAIGARVVRTVWRRTGPAAAPDVPADDQATLDLAIGYQLERRAFTGLAFTSGCRPDEPVTPACFVPTGERRGDLHHVGAVELAYTGGVIATAGYQLAVNDSSSYGQSLVRHRIALSVTTALPAEVYATAGAALQLDQYLDPLVLAKDVSSQTFTSIDDENRSELSVRLSRKVGRGITAEARVASFADSLSSDDLRFRRTVVYGGLTWADD